MKFLTWTFAFFALLANINGQDLELVEGSLKMTTFQGLGIAQTGLIDNSFGNILIDPASGGTVNIAAGHSLLLDNGDLNIKKGNSLILSDISDSELYGIMVEVDGGLYFLRNNDPTTTSLYLDDDALRVGVGTRIPNTELEVRQTQTPSLNGAGNLVDNLAGITIEDTDGSTATLFVDASNDLTFAFGGAYRGYINDQTGAYVSVSDKNLKQNIHPLNNVLKNVIQLNPSTYEYKGFDNPETTIGLIAQDVEKLFPEIVSSKDNVKAINYSAIGVIAVKAIQEQQGLIRNQAAHITTLEKQLSAQQEQIGRLIEITNSTTNK